MLEKIQNILFPLEGKNFKRHAVDQMPQTSNENMQQASEPVCPHQSSFIHVLLLKEHPWAWFGAVLDVRSFSTWPLYDNSGIRVGDTLGSDMLAC